MGEYFEKKGTVPLVTWAGVEAVRAERAAEEGGAGARVRGLGPRERLLVGREAGGGQVGGVADIVI